MSSGDSRPLLHFDVLILEETRARLFNKTVPRLNKLEVKINIPTIRTTSKPLTFDKNDECLPANEI